MNDQEPAVSDAPASPRRSFWAEHWPIVLIAAAAAALRLHGLSRRLVVLDESLIFNTDLLHLGLREFAHKIWSETTYNPGWAFVVWIMNKVFGPSTFWVRMPSALASTAATVGVYAVARAIRLSRTSALAAGAIMAVAIFQVEYGQQILPHAALPLGTCLCLWLTTMLARPENQREPWKQVALMAGLVAVFGVLVLLHNSALLLAPPLLLFWGWSIVKPEHAPASEVARTRRFTTACWVACALALGFASAGWFFAKVGEADRYYLRPFFFATFRQAPDRVITSDLVNMLDGWYETVRPGPDGWRSKAADLGYFSASRVFDFAYGNFKLRGEQQFTKGKVSWILPGVMAFLAVAGAVRTLSGASGPAARRWVVCFGATLAFILVLSCARMFPLGGVRHLICLSPLAALLVVTSFEGKSRRLSYVFLGLGMAWLVADVAKLPRYYVTTRDNVGARRLQGMAKTHGVRDVIAGDTLCSEGALRLLVASNPECRMLASDDPRFVQLVKDHKPFLLCSLNDPLLDRWGGEAVPSPFFTHLAHPLLSLGQYKATALVRAHRPISWLDWTVYLVEPKPGAESPEVVDVVPCQGPRDAMPWAFTVRFDRPMRAEEFNDRTVRLVPQPVGGVDPNQRPAAVPISVRYLAESRALLVTPRSPLAVRSHLLTLDRSIRDAEGRPIAVDAPAFTYLHRAGAEALLSRADAWMVK